ncbi:MAG TPA: MFS transporter [Ornithinibacter sp.]|nr:MFS transporter [Ornithinibacter sp.]
MTTTTGSTAQTADHRPDRLLTAPFVRLSVGDLAYFTAAGVAIYALPPYVVGPVGSDTAGAGLAFGAFAVTALLLRPFAGRLSDRVGRRPLLVGGALLAAAMMLLTGLADTLPLVVGLRLVVGVAEAAFFVASFAALADLAPPARMGEALSYNSLGLYLGLTLGPPLGELLVHSFGFTSAWLGAAALLVLAAVLVHGVGETRPARSAADGGPTALIHWRSVPPALGFLTSVVAMGGFLAFASLHAEDVGLARTSLPLAVYGVVVVVCRVAFAKVPDRLPALPLGAAALVAIAAGMALAAAWASPVGFLLGAALMGLGVSFSTPAFFSAVFATARPSERGAASGTASACIDLGLGGGSVALGLLAQSHGIPWGFGVAAGVALAGSIWTLALSRRTPAP